jgi:hypothetical protein
MCGVFSEALQPKHLLEIQKIFWQALLLSLLPKAVTDLG